MQVLFNLNIKIKKVIFLIIIIIIAILETTILDYFKIFGVKPDLFLVTVVIAGLSFDLRWAVFFAILAGILKDLFGANALYINTFLFPFYSLLTLRLSKKISIDNNFFCTAFIFSVAIMNSIIRAIFGSLENFTVIPVGIYLRIIILESFYTAAASFLIFEAIGYFTK